jgi:hypothetical protein
MADPAPDASAPASPAAPAGTPAATAPLAVPFVPPVLAALTPPVAQPAAAPAQPQTPVATPAAPSADALTVLRGSLVRSEVMRVAERAGAIDPAVVLDLTRSAYDIADDGRVIVRDDPRASVEEHVKRYLASKPYLLRPLAPAGGSPAGAVVQPPTAPPAPDLRTTDGLTALGRSLAAKQHLRRA